MPRHGNRLSQTKTKFGCPRQAALNHESGPSQNLQALDGIRENSGLI